MIATLSAIMLSLSTLKVV